MNIDSLKSLLNNFNLAEILPDLSTFPGKVELISRLAVLLGPLVLLVFGLLYVFVPAREANYSFGFRTRRGMASVEAWQFTQRLAGLVWGGLGLLLTVVMGILTISFRNLAVLDMARNAMICILWEIGLALMGWISIVVVVSLRFDRAGNARK